jgi:hypothetical protein
MSKMNTLQVHLMISTVLSTEEWIDRVMVPTSPNAPRLSEDKALA